MNARPSRSTGHYIRRRRGDREPPRAPLPAPTFERTPPRKFTLTEADVWSQGAGASSVLPVRVQQPRSGIVNDSEATPERGETAA